MAFNKKARTNESYDPSVMKGIIEGAGEVVEQKIVDTIEQNYMPYAMSVILSRAIPEIDGFKPSHRKLLFTMYKMGLLDKVRTKSANIVGQTMKLNPHGDSAIYDTMVRLSRGYEALLHPYVDSKGNFGKFYSRDMACAASRYTEAKLSEISSELFSDIEKDTVDFVDNYDNTQKEPTLLPATFPSVLVNANTGIAVGMASSICPFNLNEICKTTAMLIKDPEHDISSTLIAPDFPGGGNLIYDKQVLENIYKTGRGGIKIRARYTYDKAANCIDINSIPPTTTSEAIIEKVIELVKKNTIKEINDIRDETGIDGLKVTIDLKRGIDPEKLMQKLFRFTPLEDTFSCNFNVLIGTSPKVLGVKELLLEWIAFRVECVKRRTYFDLNKKRGKLHLLSALKKILLDIDKAIEIIRNTVDEINVIPNLMAGFNIDEKQAEYVAEIKLRHLNREYLVKRINEISDLEKDVAVLEEIFKSDQRIKEIIIEELSRVSEKYGQKRNTMLIYNHEISKEEIFDEVPDYAVNLFLTEQGYFKKITPQSLRMSFEHKLKDNDKISQHIETNNNFELLFFTNKSNVYKTKVSDFNDSKASVLGDFIPAKLNMDDGEMPIYMVVTKDYSGFMLFFFENGKVAKVKLSSYETKTNRKKLVSAYFDKFKLVTCYYSLAEKDYLLVSNVGKKLLVNSGKVSLKSSKTTQGISIMGFAKGQRLVSVSEYEKGKLEGPERYRAKNLPSRGFLPTKAKLPDEQLTF
ncbi:MAG: DNA gyrase subunit A [Eubacteriales bacterium SKADARSKE-1]|nr:DNA gyrase subunit A [Eubacteriales bacterium SKADARSKE-1]